MRTIQQMIQSEVLCCMSHMVATLSGGYGSALGGDGRGNGRLRDLESLCEQAFELASPTADYEEAAIQAGWYHHDEFKTWVNSSADRDPREDREEYASAEEVCHYCDIEPYDREVFEHWAVTGWFADKLIEAGEKVDKDFAGLCVWARTTTGQGIASDGVVARIYARIISTP